MRITSRGLSQFLNPISRLGKRYYSVFFPLLINLILCVLSEVYAYGVAKNPMVVGAYIIFLNVALLLYFSFRDGIRGGFISAGIAIAYYFYIMDTRHYKGAQLQSGIETTLVLAILYFLLGWIIGWLKQTIDALIERESDEKHRLQAIVQQLPVGVLICDRYGEIVQANKQIEYMLGKKIPAGFVIGKDEFIPVLEHGKPAAPSQSALAQTIATGKPVVGKEYAIPKEHGSHLHVTVSAAPIHNSRGETIAAASIITDITQQKEMEERKDDFVNMASHELKTPLTSMKLYLGSLQRRIKQYNDSRAESIVKNITYQTERLQLLVNDLLDVTRLQTGKLSLQKEELDLASLVAESIDALSGIAKQKIIYEQGKTIRVFGDKFRLYQVLTNLLTNAMKYAPADSTITLCVKRQSMKAVVSVADEGIGISKSEHKKVFDRLYQVSDPKVKTFPGLGMGLYISKEIIKRHKGTIWVESTKGKGATFFFSLPLADRRHSRTK